MSDDTVFEYWDGTGGKKQWQALRLKLHRLIKSGSIKKQPCNVCGTKERLHAHHPDYSYPFFVMWLCVKHHKRWHKLNPDVKSPFAKTTPELETEHVHDLDALANQGRDSSIDDLLDCIDSLNHHQRWVLIKYYGIDGDKMTSQEIADHFGFTVSRVNQIVTEATDKLHKKLSSKITDVAPVLLTK